MLNSQLFKVKEVSNSKGDFLSQEDELFITRLVSKNIVNIESINKSIKEKWTLKDDSPLFQFMLKKRAISITDVSKITKDEHITKDSQQQTKVEIKYVNDIPIVSHATIKKIDRYEIIRELGRGGMGVVYEAHDTELGRTVALKTLRSNDDASSIELERFAREVRLSAALQHPNIISVYETGIYNNIHFFTMEYIEGIPIDEYVSKNRLNFDEIVSLIRDVANALALAHSKNIVHRDIKPANILVDKDGVVHLGDFGLARNMVGDKSLTVSGMPIGTPAYMSPEQASGKMVRVGKYSDVYSLGSVFYELLTGKPPFIGASLTQTISAILSQELISPKKLVRGLSYDLETICLKCLEKDIPRRYPNARALAMDLDRYLNGEPILARPPSIFYKSSKFILRNKLPFSFATVCLIFLTLAIYFFLLAPGFLTLSVKNQQFANLSPEVFINGEKNLSNDLNHLSLSYGYHKISLNLEGYESEDFVVQISPGQEVKIEKQMVSKKGKIGVRSFLSQVEASFKNIKTNEVYTFILSATKIFDEKKSLSKDRSLEFFSVNEYQIPSGEYEATFKKENYFSERKKITIIPDQTIQTNVNLQSMIIWTRDVKQKIPLNAMMLADTDIDGKLELLISSVAGGMTSYSFETHEKLWEISGNLTFSKHQSLLRDVDKDGFPDFIFVHGDCFKIVSGKSHKSIFEMPRYWGTGFVFNDINKDGHDDLILFRTYNGIECHNLKDGKILWKNDKCSEAYFTPIFLNDKTILHSAKGELYELNINNGISRTVYSFFGKPETNRDPEDMKLVWISGKPILLWYRIEKGFCALDLSSRQELWKCNIKPFNIGMGGIVLADVDKDGVVEAILHTDKLYCINIKNGKIVWQCDTYNQNNTSPSTVVDLDGDGILEIIAISKNGKIYVIDSRTGNSISEFSYKNQIDSLIPYDINHDGILEILVLSEDQFYAIRYTPEKQIKIYEEDPLLSTISKQFLDWNKDGHLDFVLGNKMGELYCLNGKNWEILWRHKIVNEMNNFPVIIDLNKDKKLEIVIQGNDGVAVFNDVFQKIWSFSCESQSSKTPIIADVDNDGELEIIITTGGNGYIYCLKSSNGKLLWQQQVYRIFTMPYLEDVDNDNRLDLIAISTMSFGPSGGIWCFNAADGSIKWQMPIPSSVEAAYTNIVTSDLNKDGILEVFVPQIGHISCLDGKTGKGYWHKRLNGSDVGVFLITDLNKDSNKEILIATLDNSIHFLDAKTGEVLWYQNMILDKRNFAWEPSLVRKSTGIINLDIDLNHDGIPDFAMIDSKDLFCLFSGSDGKYLGSMNDIEIGDVLPFKVDCDGDQKLDWVFISRKNQLVVIYDILSRFEKIVQTPRYFDSTEQNKIFLWLYRFQNLLMQKNYKQLSQEISKFSNQIKDYPYWEIFYRTVCSMQQQGILSEQSVKELQKVGLDFVLNHFLRTIYFLEKNDVKEVKNEIEPLIKESILLFHKIFQQHKHLMKRELYNRLKEILPIVFKETDCDLDIANAYKYAIFTNKSWESDYFLELSLRYGLPERADYETRRKTYIKKVFDNSEGIRSAYHQSHAMAVLNHAIEVLSDDVEIINKRADGLIKSRIAIEEGIKEYQRSLKILPEQPEVYLQLAQIYCEINNLQKAIVYIDEAIKFDKKECTINYLYKIFIYMLSNKQEKFILEELEKIEKKISKKMTSEDIEFVMIIKNLLEGNKIIAVQKLEKIAPKLTEGNRDMQWLFYKLYYLIK